ncbi:MAG: RNA-binding S4 domain-containing protein [Bacillota bacterium]|nr:RNA-binding S4 domain-containing protein [Bacillota bacterium]
MRVDKFLKNSRLIKRRTVAKEACDTGRVSLNGREAKAGSEVKPGDELTVRFGNGEIRVRVLAVPETVKKEDASSMYEAI